MHTQTSTSTTDPKRRYLCRHVFTDGHRCGSPSLRGEELCYYHTRSRREAPCASRTGTFVMQRVDDRASIQLALFDVLSRLSSGDIEYKRGSILLYGLQIASSNLPRQARPLAEQPPQVEEITSDYDLGDLAPIAEIPTPEQASVPDTQPREAVIPTTTKPGAPQPALSLPKGLDPETWDGAPQPPAPTRQPILPPEAPQYSTSNSVVPTEAPSQAPSQPKHPEPSATATEPAHPAPDQSSTNPPTPAPLRPPLPTRDAAGRLYPPPHKLDPPDTGKVPWPRGGKPQPLPRYTGINDSHPRMAP